MWNRKRWRLRFTLIGRSVVCQLNDDSLWMWMLPLTILQVSMTDALSIVNFVGSWMILLGDYNLSAWLIFDDCHLKTNLLQPPISATSDHTVALIAILNKIKYNCDLSLLNIVILIKVVPTFLLATTRILTKPKRTSSKRMVNGGSGQEMLGRSTRMEYLRSSVSKTCVN